MDLGGGRDARVAKTVLQDVVVLSIGRYVTNNAARTIEADTGSGKDKVRNLSEDFSFSSVTLEVEPAQAQMIALLVSGENSLTLSLRNNDDLERMTVINATTFPDILGADMARVKGAHK
jgi:Flp pilus assembly protein CpaB